MPQAKETRAGRSSAKLKEKRMEIETKGTYLFIDVFFYCLEDALAVLIHEMQTLFYNLSRENELESR